MIKEIIDIIVFGACMETFIGIIAFFYAQVHFLDNPLGRCYRPPTLRTWLCVFGTALFRMSILFWFVVYVTAIAVIFTGVGGIR